MRLSTIAVVAISILALAGCSGTSSTSSTSSSSSTPSTASTTSGAQGTQATKPSAARGKASGPKARVSFKSPAVIAGQLPARYTCDGQDVWPPLEWSGVPASTRELAVVVLGLTPDSSDPGTSTATIEWAIAGIKPSLHRLAAGELPAGAHVGLDSTGKKQYSICPPPHETSRYEFDLYAVPNSIKVPAAFAGVQLLRAIAEPQSHTSASVGGTFKVSYKRA